jgi:hypothetical protein
MKTKLLYLSLFVGLISSAIWGYETEWQDNKLGPSSFKLHGYYWFGYENIDAQKGKVDSGSTQGFTMGRVYVRIDGNVKEGDFKGWKYHITLETNPLAGNSIQSTYIPASTYIKYAYFSIPVGLGFNVIGGMQNNPTSTAGKYSLENLWAHRYLDADGKAMWDQLGVTPSSDLGVGLEQETELYQIHLLFGNGEGGRKPNAQDLKNKDLSDLAKGAGDSYGYHLYGKFSLSPLGTKEDLPTRVFLNVPFVLRNIYGIQRAEYEYVDTLDFTTQKFIVLKGDPTAKRDYAYGLEADVLLNLNDIKIGIGAGQIIDKDIRRSAIKVDQNLLTTPITIGNFYNYYQPAKDSIGVANYVFLWAQYQKFGIVFRHYIKTDDASISDKMNYAEGLSVAEQLVIQDANNGVLGDLSPEKALKLIRSGTVDAGKSKMKTYLLALEYYANKSFKMAVGIKQATTTKKDGTPYKITPFQASNFRPYQKGSSGNPDVGYTPESYSNFVASQLGLPANSLTDTDVIGTNRVERQIFFRSQFTY